LSRKPKALSSNPSTAKLYIYVYINVFPKKVIAYFKKLDSPAHQTAVVAPDHKWVLSGQHFLGWEPGGKLVSLLVLTASWEAGRED
jgi:hypothetical protein